MKPFIFIFIFAILITPPYSNANNNVYGAANSILEKSGKDARCRTFFRYYLDYLNSGDSSRASALMMLLDEKVPGLVDFCDANRSKYL
jgi:hypothetical protein